MHKHSSPMMQLTKRGAAFTLRQLIDELHLFMGYFPDLRGAFADDELPLPFILKRDSRLTEASAWPRQVVSPHAKQPARRRTTSPRARSRGGPRKQMSDG